MIVVSAVPDSSLGGRLSAPRTHRFRRPRTRACMLNLCSPRLNQNKLKTTGSMRKCKVLRNSLWQDSSFAPSPLPAFPDLGYGLGAWHPVFDSIPSPSSVLRKTIGKWSCSGLGVLPSAGQASRLLLPMVAPAFVRPPMVLAFGSGREAARYWRRSCKSTGTPYLKAKLPNLPSICISRNFHRATKSSRLRRYSAYPDIAE
jgi:hypothetical protein